MRSDHAQPSLFIAAEGTVAFRPIHYLGSKLRLLEPILAALTEESPIGIACDLFAGSGTVFRALATHRPSISVDIQEYSRVLCSAVVAPKSADPAAARRLVAAARDSETRSRLSSALEPLLETEASCIRAAERGQPDALLEFLAQGSLIRHSHEEPPRRQSKLDRIFSRSIRALAGECLADPAISLAVRHFGGAFFSFRQAIDLDALLGEASASVARDIALAPVLSTASDLVNSIGKQFAQPLSPYARDGTPKYHLVSKILTDRTRDVFATYLDWAARFRALPPAAPGSRAIRSDCFDFLENNSLPVSVFYADPPYTREHYSRYYHALETMCLRDSPALSTSKIRTGGISKVSRGIYREGRHQSAFSIKSQAPAAFARLFAAVRRHGTPFVLSYSPFADSLGARPRMLSVGDLSRLARHAFSQVDVRPAAGLVHSRLNSRSKSVRSPLDAEVLIICRP